MENEKNMAEIVSQAWNNLNADLLEPLLSDAFEYESVWVFQTLKGKKEYLEYLRGKYDAIKKSKSNVTASVFFQKQIGKYVVLLQQDGTRGSAIELFIKDELIIKMWIRPLDLTLPGIFTSNKPKSKGIVTSETRQIKSINSGNHDNHPLLREIEKLRKRPEEEQPWYMKSMIANRSEVQTVIRCIEQYFEKEFPNISISWNFQTERSDYCDLSFSFGSGTFDVLIDSHYGNIRFLSISQIDKLINECKKNNHVACIAALKSETKVSIVNPTTDDAIPFAKCMEK